MFRFALKMSQEYSLSAFVRRSAEAEQKLLILRQHLRQLKDQAVLEKESQLRAENELLKEKVVKLKSQLKELEIANGVEQVAMPSKSTPIVNEKQDPAPKKENTKTEGSNKKEPKKPKQKQESQPKKAPTKTNEAKPVDVSRLDMRIAKIVNIKHHPDADTLYVEDIDVGEENMRTVCTGVVKQVPIEQMENRMVVLMCNLKPVKMRGVVSQAMVMCANNTEHLEVIDPPPGCVPGDKVIFDGYPGEPDATLNPKKKVWERVQPDLNTNDECVACYKGIPFKVEGKGVCKVKTLKNCPIK